jgi:hypothetical protein
MISFEKSELTTRPDPLYTRYGLTEIVTKWKSSALTVTIEVTIHLHLRGGEHGHRALSCLKLDMAWSYQECHHQAFGQENQVPACVVKPHNSRLSACCQRESRYKKECSYRKEYNIKGNAETWAE